MLYLCRRKSFGKCVTFRKKSVGKCVTFNEKSCQKCVNFAKKSVGKGENRRAVPLPEGFVKINERTSNGEPIYKKGKKYYSPDKDQHNGGTWKRTDSPKDLESRTTRDGTYNENLERIGD